MEHSKLSNDMNIFAMASFGHIHVKEVYVFTAKLGHNDWLISLQPSTAGFGQNFVKAVSPSLGRMTPWEIG